MMVLEDDSPVEAASTPSTPRNLSAWSITIPYIDFYDDDVKRERVPVFCIDVERNDRKAGKVQWTTDEKIRKWEKVTILDPWRLTEIPLPSCFALLLLNSYGPLNHWQALPVSMYLWQIFCSYQWHWMSWISSNHWIVFLHFKKTFCRFLVLWMQFRKSPSRSKKYVFLILSMDKPEQTWWASSAPIEDPWPLTSQIRP